MRTFTLEEAQSLLPVLESLLKRAIEARRSAQTAESGLNEVAQRIYFAGDTYVAGFMQRIARELRPDVALIPVTTFRIPMTMGESQAVEAVRRLAPQFVIPIHLGISPRSPLLRTSQTAESFRERVRQAGLNAQVAILREGESWSPAPKI